MGLTKSNNVAVVGAGITGAVLAYTLAQQGIHVDVFENRDHIAGNCHTQRDAATGIMIHTYGPHIFHTSNDAIWKFVNMFDEFMPYINRVKAITGGKVFSLPVNLHTINQFFGKTLSPSQASEFIEGLSDNIGRSPSSFEEQALMFIGKQLYEAFFKDYTIKQWGIDPKNLPASILKRLPIRFNYDDNYYNSKYQGIPKNGYTYIVEKLLDNKNINLFTCTKYDRSSTDNYAHIFYTGPLDAWFNYSEGRLGYRTLRFEKTTTVGDYQGNAVINYCDNSVPWTRITEHKHFAPWESHQDTVIYKEYSDICGIDDIPYYPIRLVNEKKILTRYQFLAEQEKSVSFCGRLATYRYLDMHVAIQEALDTAQAFISCHKSGNAMPSFLFSPQQ